MNDIDTVIYVKKMMAHLKADNFFSDINPFMDEQLLYEAVLAIATENVNNGLVPQLNQTQFMEAINQVKTQIVSKTLDELIDKDLVNIVGVDDDGNLLYTINPDVDLENLDEK
jgi:hypothetical protein